MQILGSRVDQVINWSIMRGFDSLCNLEELKVNNICKSPEALKMLFTSLKQNKGMKKLTLECIYINISTINRL